MNQLFVSMVAQHALTMSESNRRRTWFFFDEFREAGKLQGLHSLIVRGRSKGCCVVLGFQDIQGLQAVYGEKVANEIVGQCGNKAFLRMESSATAKWASECVSDFESIEVNLSQTYSRHGDSSTNSQQRSTRPRIMAAEFLSMPPIDEHNGLHGVYLVRSKGLYEEVYTPSELSQYLKKLDGRIASFEPTPTHYQFLEPWSQHDEARLGLTMISDGIETRPSQAASRPESKQSDLGIDRITR